LPPQIDAALIDDLPEAAGAPMRFTEDGHLLLSRRSSNLRQQVLAHFTPDKRDTALIRDTWRIEWRDAAGEFGARLRAIELARSAPEMATRRSRATRCGRHRVAANGLCSWQLRQYGQGDFRPQLVFAEDIDFALADDLFGLVPDSSRGACAACARSPMHTASVPPAARARRNGKAGACTAYPAEELPRRLHRQGNCRAAQRPPDDALAKFKVKAWPYQGPVVLIERDEFGMREDLHLVDRWRLAGHATQRRSPAGVPGDGPSCNRFDPDIYRLIHKVLQAGKLRVRPCPAFSL
jgi:DNA polymerase-3 subunit epsilon